MAETSSQIGMSSYDVVVIIPVYNDTNRLRLCLEALANQQLADVKLEVLVVDNNSTKDISVVTRQFPFVRLLHESKPGSYNARNRALNELGDQHFIGFTDADCIPATDWVERAVRCFKESPNVAVGGPVRMFSECEDAPSLAERYEILFAFPQKDAIEREHYSVTANLFITREMLEKAGFFNSDLYSGGDYAYGQQLRCAGFKLRYIDQLVIYHPARATIGQLTSRIRRTAGGSYQQREHYEYLRRRYSWRSILYGVRPPFRMYLKIFAEPKVGLFSKLALCLLATSLRMHQALVYTGYKLKFLRRMERF